MSPSRVLLVAAGSIALLLPTVGTASAANAVVNGSFEATGSAWLSPWAFTKKTGGAGSISQTSATRVDGTYSALASVTSASASQPWVVQLSQAKLAISSGVTYTITFSSKANASRSLSALLQQTASPYATYVSRTFTVSTSWQTFSFSFASGTTNSDVSLRFNLASATGSVWLDAVSMTGGSTPSPSPTPTPAPSGSAAKGVALSSFVSYWGSNTAGMDSDFADLVAGNLGWARIDLRYTSSPNPAFDAAVASAQRHGIHLVVVVYKNSPTNDLGDSTSQSIYKTWLAQVVNRYKYWVKHWEIMNEPNLHYEWNINDSSGSDPTAYAAAVQRYVTLLSEAYAVVKANDVTATVLFGGLSEWTVERYVGVLRTTSAYHYFDVIGFHPYGSDPTTDVNRLKSFEYQMSLSSNYAYKPIWISEIGFNTSWSNKAGYVSTEQQKASYLTQTLPALKSAGAKVPMFWYTLHENTSSPGYGLEQKDKSTLHATYLPAYYSYKSLGL